MSHKPGDPFYLEFVTSSPATQAATDADTLPVATANHNGADDAAFTLTVAHLDTGRYTITGTIPSTYASGDVLNVSVAATVGGVAGKGSFGPFVLDGNRVSEVYAKLGGAQITTVTPVAISGNATVVRGTDYSSADSEELLWTDSGNTWPVLTGATIAVKVYASFAAGAAPAYTFTGSVLTATGAAKQIQWQPTAADTLSLPAGAYRLEIAATLASGRIVPLVRGLLAVAD